MNTPTPMPMPNTYTAEQLRTMPQDTSHFKPFTMDMIYACEPSLETVMQNSLKSKGATSEERINVYNKATNDVYDLIGWNAADPRLRSSEAWDCFFNTMLDALNVEHG